MELTVATTTTSPRQFHPVRFAALVRRVIVHVALVLAWAAALYYAWAWLHIDPDAVRAQGGSIGMDARAYWAAWEGGLYTAEFGRDGAYLYSPAFAQVLWPLTLLPWPVFAALWWGSTVVAFVWLLAPLGWRWGVPAFALVLNELTVGNIHAYLALVIVLGLRCSALWSFVLLTKITPGVGLLWFAVRREWRHLTVALATTVGAVAVSAAVDHTLWLDWIRFLTDSHGAPELPGLPGARSLPWRLACAAALVVYGARTDRRWLLAPAVLLSLPHIGHAAISLLAAIPRLRKSSGLTGRRERVNPSSGRNVSPSRARADLYG